MKLSRARFLVFAALVSFALAFTAGQALGQDTLKVSVRTPAATLHPYGAYSNTEFSVIMGVYDCLVDRDPQGKLIPDLAERWEPVNATTWRFYLRKGVTFQDGTPFTADDVAYSVEAAARPASRFKYVAGKIKEVRVVDAHTVDIETKEPWPILPDALYLTVSIISKKYCQGKTDEYLAEHPMGTGHYILKEWVRESHIILEGFDGHWSGAPPIKKIVINPITNDATRLAGMITGSTDLCIDVPLQYVDLLKKAEKLKVVSLGGARVILLSMRLDNPEFYTAKKKVRQALLMGINEDEINARLMNGMAVPAAQLPAPAYRGYDKSITRPQYNPKRARQLLAEAGYPDGFSIDLHVPNDRYIMDKDIGVAVAQQLSKIGVKVNLVARTKTIHFKEIRANKLDFFMIGWEEVSFDSARLIGTFLRTGAEWGGRYSNPEFDKKLKQADMQADLALRSQELQALNRFIADEALILPLHYQPIVYGLSKKIKSFQPNIKKVVSFERISY